jgi:MFS transporter, DHA1 family, multidrug resistance protein
LNLKAIFWGFKEILKVPDFSIYVFAGSFSFAGLFVYIAGSPSMFMDGFKVSAQVYGIIFAVLAVAMIGGGQLNLWLTKRYKSPQILKVSTFAQTLMSAIFFLGTYFQVFTMEGTVAILFLLLACAGIGFPNAAAIALASFTTNVGSASALMGFLQLGVGSVTSAVVGALNYSGSLPTSVVMFASSATASIILLIGANKKGE